MSNNQRWVRIPTFEMFTALLAVPNVVIAEFRTYDKVSDAANFVELLFENPVENFINVINQSLSHVFLTSDFGSFYSQEFVQLSHAYGCDSNYVEEGWELSPDTCTWLKSTMISAMFNPSAQRGFYLLQEAVLKTVLLPITEASDVPADGIVFYDNNREHLLVQYPKGLFHLMYYNESDNEAYTVCSNIPSTDLGDLKVKKTHLVWKPLTLNLNNAKGLNESLKHLKETFISISGDTPDEWFDKQNQEVI